MGGVARNAPVELKNSMAMPTMLGDTRWRISRCTWTSSPTRATIPAHDGLGLHEHEVGV